MLLTVSLLSLFSFPANAAVLEQRTVSGSFVGYGLTGGTSWNSWSSKSYTSQSSTFYQTSSTAYSPHYLSLSRFRVGGLESLTGLVTFVVSFYASANGDAPTPVQWGYGSYWDKPAGYRFFYTDDNNVEHQGDSVSVRSFSANGSRNSRGISLEVSSMASEVHFFTAFEIRTLGYSSSVSYSLTAFELPSSDAYIYSIYVPSARVIATESSGDLEALKDIADAVIAGNQILSAMYGDILAVCNQIYQRTGSILETQRLANTYLIAIRDYLQSLNTTTEAIYSLLGAKFDLLISTIQTESDDIQAAIDKAVQDMIAYLDAAFSGAVGQLPSVGDSLQDQSDALENQESQWMGSMTDNFESLQMGNFAFPVGIISGFGLITSIFSQLWDKLGAYAAIYTFPLFLGIALLLIGRMSKFAGDQSSSRKDGE